VPFREKFETRGSGFHSFQTKSWLKFGHSLEPLQRCAKGHAFVSSKHARAAAAGMGAHLMLCPIDAGMKSTRFRGLK
jgi:hypothetical protein